MRDFSFINSDDIPEDTKTPVAPIQLQLQSRILAKLLQYIIEEMEQRTDVKLGALSMVYVRVIANEFDDIDTRKEREKYRQFINDQTRYMLYRLRELGIEVDAL